MVLTGEAGERGRFVQRFEEFCAKHSIVAATQNAMDLALEEHLTNVLSYGYSPGEPRHVDVRVGVDSTWLWAEIRDDGLAYDPLSRPPVDITVPLEEKPIGGLGVHLMRQFMDELHYAREASQNVLRLRKRLRQAAA
jgi:anti-sigma regulatory factor (Ser/Thr protein kinase)